MRHARTSSGQARGFALAAVLWLLAGIAVVVTGVAQAVKQAATVNRDLQLRAQMLHAEQRAVAELSYLVGTHRSLGVGAQLGFGTLRLDGQRYVVPGPTGPAAFEVILQDASGLANLGEGDPQLLAQLLMQCGIALPMAQRLSEAAADFVDADDLKRLNGAERFDYAGLGLPGPSNRRLNSQAQVRQVLGWSEAMGRNNLQPCLEHTFVGDSPQLNPWTAPAQVLVAAGMTPEFAQAAVAQRQVESPQRLSSILLDFADRPQNRVDGFNRFANNPGSSVRVRLAHPPSGLVREFVWSRSSAGQLQAFWITQARWITQAPVPASGPNLAGLDGSQDKPPSALSSFIEQSIANPEAANAPPSSIFSR